MATKESRKAVDGFVVKVAMPADEPFARMQAPVTEPMTVADLTLEQMQAAAGGYIEMPYRWASKTRKGVTIDLVCNEEGRINGMLPGIFLMVDGQRTDVYGPVEFVGADNDTGETIPLTADEVAQITYNPREMMLATVNHGFARRQMALPIITVVE